MSRNKTFAIALVCACTSLAASAKTVAINLNAPSHLKPFRQIPGQVQKLNHSPNAARLVDARKEAAAEAKGIVTPKALAATSSSWTVKHTLYVGCTTSPAGSTYADIKSAVNAAQLYTLIKVCPGTYEAGGSDTGITVSTSYIEIEGTSAHSGAETLTCGSGPVPTDDSFGILVLGSHDIVKNLTVVDCNYAVESGFAA